MASSIIVAGLFALQDPVAFAQTPAPPPSPQAGIPAPPASSLSSGQLDSMVAPIALYPDQLLSQVLVASTYPQDIQAANQWVSQNPNLQGKALVDAAAQQPWDPSVQALVAFPQVLSMMAQNINWTSQLGDAFLSQQAGVFDAVQRMRQQARQEGKLQSTPQQTVSTTTEGGQTYIQIEPANPQVVYVPQYDPAAIWGPAPYYPYPSIGYPSTGALITSGLLGFGTGIFVGSLFGGGWGWYPGWGRHSVFVNRGFFERNRFNTGFIGRGGSWMHNPNRGGAGRFRPGMPGFGNRPGGAGFANRPGFPGVGNRPGTPGFGNRPGGVMNRPTPGQVQRQLGGAQRIAPGNIGRTPGMTGNRFGGAQRMSPGMTRGPQFRGRPGGMGFGRGMGGGRMGGGRMGGGHRR